MSIVRSPIELNDQGPGLAKRNSLHLKSDERNVSPEPRPSEKTTPKFTSRFSVRLKDNSDADLKRPVQQVSALKLEEHEASTQ